MKKNKFIDSQIALILRQAEDGLAITDVCRRAGISEQTFYRWRQKYVGLMPSEMRRLNPKLKEIEGLLDEEALRIISKELQSNTAPTKNQIRRFLQERLASDKIISLGKHFDITSKSILDGLKGALDQNNSGDEKKLQRA